MKKFTGWKWIVRCLLAGVAVLLVAVWVLVWDGLHDEVHNADLGLVLGNTVNPDGSLSPRLKARMDRTLELYREGRFQQVMVSGALGKEGHDEACVMGEYLVANGVPRAQVIVDRHGYTTLDTARNASEFMKRNGKLSVLVVSQYFHVPRCRLALRRYGVESVYTAHARHVEWRDGYSIPRELLGCVNYALRRVER